MLEALVVSNVVLWIAVVILSALVFALVRQVGVLHERVAPVGALMIGRGPNVGDAAPLQAVEALDGTPRTVGGPAADGRSTLLFFLSPSCPVCKQLLPALHSIARGEGAWLRLVLVGDGTREEHGAFAKEHGLDGLEYVLSPVVGVTHQVGKLPYAVLVDGAGVVRAKGLVNTREHLESLFEAQERGVASLQEYLERSQDRTEAARP